MLDLRLVNKYYFQIEHLNISSIRPHAPLCTELKDIFQVHSPGLKSLSLSLSSWIFELIGPVDFPFLHTLQVINLVGIYHDDLLKKLLKSVGSQHEVETEQEGVGD